MSIRLVAVALCFFLAVGVAPGRADDKASDSEKSTEKGDVDKDRQKHFEAFTARMQKVKLVGKFTILGRAQDKLPEEEYTINSVKKLPRGDYWQFNARIKYGGVDVPMSFPLEVKWSGDTPVITLTKLTIPAMGTFSARVLLYNDKYAGTWTHGKAGGHMFGVIKPIEEKPADEKQGTEKQGTEKSESKNKKATP